MDTLHKWTKILNDLYWRHYMNQKWCKHMGYVSWDYDCDGCTQCESSTSK